MNIIYKILKNKNKISAYLALVTIIYGTVGEIYNGKTLLVSIFKSIQLFTLNLSTEELNILTGIAFIAAMFTIFLIAIVFFMKDVFDAIVIKNTFKKSYTAVFGLGEINRRFLDSLENSEKRSSTIIIEENSNNKYIEEYQRKGFGVFRGNFSDLNNANFVDFKNMQHAVIALGDDRHNIELASKIIREYNEKDTGLKLVVHIQNKDLEILFHTKFIHQNDKKINIKTFSFYEEVAKDLFTKNYIDGDSLDYINSNNEFQTIVLGDGRLIEKVMYQIALLSHLPNENNHIVNLIDKNAEQLLVQIKKLLFYRNEENSFLNLELKAINLDKNDLEFYSDTIWYEKNLVNVIVAFDEEEKNLDTAIELYNRVYLQKAIDKQYMPKILLGIYDEMLLSDTINTNNNEFKNFYTFGNVKNILSYKELIDEEIDLIAKLIHNGYGEVYNKNSLGQNENSVNKKWFNDSRFSDKLSSIAQAKHIDIKLKSMGLKKTKETELDKVELLKNNQKFIFGKLNPQMQEVGLNEDVLIEYSKELEKSYRYEKVEIKYFPKKFDTLFERLVRMEHDRWNAYHFLNGWKYTEIAPQNKEEKDQQKAKKEHNCLLSLKDFDKDTIKITVIHDIYSLLYIPNYLAETAYQIVAFEHIEGSEEKKFI